MKAVHIYFLYESDTRAVRYVGKTEQKLSTRLVAHLRDKTKCHRVNWIRGLIARGAKPEIEVLETIHGDHPWQESERYWISRLKELGAILVNGTSGGDGVRNVSPEGKARILAAHLGRKASPETCKKISDYRKTWRANSETRAAMSNAHKGRKITWIGKIAEKLRKLSPEDVETIRRRLEAGELNKDLAAEFKVHRTTLSKIKIGTYR